MKCRRTFSWVGGWNFTLFKSQVFNSYSHFFFFPTHFSLLWHCFEEGGSSSARSKCRYDNVLKNRISQEVSWFPASPVFSWMHICWFYHLGFVFSNFSLCSSLQQKTTWVVSRRVLVGCRNLFIRIPWHNIAFTVNEFRCKIFFS